MKQIGACNDIEKLCWAPFESFKGQAKQEEEKTTELVMENISLKIINLFEILFLKLIFFIPK